MCYIGFCRCTANFVGALKTNLIIYIYLCRKARSEARRAQSEAEAMKQEAAELRERADRLLKNLRAAEDDVSAA